jgi:hypothetical protein
MLCLLDRSNIVLTREISGNCFKVRRCWNVALNHGVRDVLSSGMFGFMDQGIFLSL